MLFLDRPLVVLTHQRCCQIHSVSIAKLENAQRRHVLRLRLIETPNKCANNLVLFTAGGDQNGVRALDGVQHRRRTTPTAYRRKLTLRQTGDKLDDLGGIHILQSNQTDLRRRADALLELVKDRGEAEDRLILRHDE